MGEPRTATVGPAMAMGTLVLLLTASGATETAFAQDAGVTEADRLAREAFDEGTELYAQGHYDDAVKAYERAYELSPRPLILLNLSTAYERALHLRDAADTLERYLDLAEPQNEQELRARVERLREMADATESRTEPQPAPAEPTPAEPSPAAAPQPAPAPAPSNSSATWTPPASEPRSAPTPEGGGSSTVAILGAVMGVAGLIATGVAIGTGVAALGEADTLNASCQTRCPVVIDGEPAADRLSRAEGLATASTATGVAGALLGVAGTIMVIVGASGGGGEDTAQLVPAVSPDGVGLVVTGRL